jgi:predicted ATPase
VPVPGNLSGHGSVRLIPPALDQWDKPTPMPRISTPIFGREVDLAAAKALLRREQVRLLALTGPGGVGKTRLALRIAEEIAGDFPDGIAFVPLATLADSVLVLPAIAQAIGVGEVGALSLSERLALALDGRKMLLVLDNFEHLSRASSLIAALLAATSAVKLLITSRAPLRISAEHEYEVAPLALPPAHSVSVSDLSTIPSIALFVDRARAVRSDFDLRSSNAPAVVMLCRNLDGLPLAIELAAARCKVLPLAGILEQLSRGLGILGGGLHDYPDRLRTMRAAIAWSYNLLNQSEQRLFRTLSVFNGGCSLNAVEAVAGIDQDGSRLTSADLLDLVSSLINASLMRQEEMLDDDARLAMMGTVRAFGLERLAERGEGNEVRARHAAWCLTIAEQAAEAFNGRGPGIWAKRLKHEIDNLRSAMAWLESTGDIESLTRLLTTLAPLWLDLGHEQEGHRWLTRALGSDVSISGALRVRGSALTGRLSIAIGNFPVAITLAAECTGIASAIGSSEGMADALCLIGNIARGLGDEQAAAAHYADALEGYRNLGDRYNIGYTLIQMAKLGDLGSVDRPGNPEDQDRARMRGEEALQLYRNLGNTRGTARALHQVAYIAYKRGDYTDSASLSKEALAMLWDDQNLTEAASILEDLADIAGMTGRWRIAARLYGAASATRETLGVPMWPAYRDEYEREVSVTRKALAPDDFQAAWLEGRSLSVQDAIMEALRAAELLMAAPAFNSAPALKVLGSSGLRKRCPPGPGTEAPG